MTPATVIGFLTILGYSLYDTVVVFDKVRENTAGLAGGSRMTYSQAANLAVNQTLVRSINTSIIALLPIGAILFAGVVLLGAGPLKDLSLALFVGVAVGAYSSIFIATPLLAQLKEREPAMQALAKRVASSAAGRRTAGRTASRRAPRRPRPSATAPSSWPTTSRGRETGDGGHRRPSRAPAASRPSARRGHRATSRRKSSGGQSTSKTSAASDRGGGRRDRPQRAAAGAKIRDVPDFPDAGHPSSRTSRRCSPTPRPSPRPSTRSGAPFRGPGRQGRRYRGPRVHPRRRPSPTRSASASSRCARRASCRGRRAASYDLEYGAATHRGHGRRLRAGDRVLIVDDVLATGGTAERDGASWSAQCGRRGRRASRCCWSCPSWRGATGCPAMSRLTTPSRVVRSDARGPRRPTPVGLAIQLQGCRATSSPRRRAQGRCGRLTCDQLAARGRRDRSAADAPRRRG